MVAFLFSLFSLVSLLKTGATEDQTACLPCDTGVTFSPTFLDCLCGKDKFLVERDNNGVLLKAK